MKVVSKMVIDKHFLSNVKIRRVRRMMRIQGHVRLPVYFVLVATWVLLLALPVFSEDPVILQPDNDNIQRATINLESYVFAPNQLIVQKGIPVELTLQNNSFLVPHNFLLDSPEGERLVDAEVSSGESEKVQFTLTKPGAYPFYCDKELLFFPKHREEGMEGSILVR